MTEDELISSVNEIFKHLKGKDSRDVAGIIMTLIASIVQNNFPTPQEKISFIRHINDGVMQACFEGKAKLIPITKEHVN